MTDLLSRLRAALTGETAWVVGGAVRDELLGRDTEDYDLAVAGDPRSCARALAKALDAASFPLSDRFGGWRVVGGDPAWHVDLVPLRDGDLEADLSARDYTINAMARPLSGGELVDLFGGARDLEGGVLRMVSGQALIDDPVRTLRGVRFAHELAMTLEPETAKALRRHAPALAGVAGERVFAELIRILTSDDPGAGLALLERHGLAAVVLPELTAMRGVKQSEFHALDVHDHTLAVLDEVVQLQVDPAAAGIPAHAEGVVALLREPLADGLDRGQAMRLAALMHDVAKPQTRAVRSDGFVTFREHDIQGAALVLAVLRRWRTSGKLATYVAGLTRHHLRLGYMVHERPLTRRAAWRYMRLTAPYAAETTLLTIADRRATRGRNAEAAIAAHVALADEMLALIIARREEGEPAPLIRGDELARALGLRPGPELGQLMERLDEDAYAGDIASREQAVARAHELRAETARARGTGAQGGSE